MIAGLFTVAVITAAICAFSLKAAEWLADVIVDGVR
jgi:putative exporter of polyketide antibiotics